MSRKRKPFKKLLSNVVSNSKTAAEKGQRYGRKKRLDVDVDAKFLEELWYKQNGICAICKGQMYLDDIYDCTGMHPQKPSPDRIDSKIAYLETNLQIIHQGCNHMKNKHSQEVADKFVKNVKNNNFKPLKNNKIKSNVGVNMNNQSLLMDTILYGATLGNKEGVEALVNMYSNTKEAGGKSTTSSKAKAAMINKKSYFTSKFIDADNEPTQSIKDVMMNHLNKEEDVAKDISRFYSSKAATDFMKMGVKFVNTGIGDTAADRYHLKKSDVDSYLN